MIIIIITIMIMLISMIITIMIMLISMIITMIRATIITMTIIMTKQ